MSKFCDWIKPIRWLWRLFGCGSEKIKVNVCNRSNLRARPVCLWQEVKEFDRGSEPKEICSLPILIVCDASGEIAGDLCFNRHEEEFTGEIPGPCHLHPTAPVIVRICKKTGLKITKYCWDIEDKAFPPGTEPTESCNFHTDPAITPFPRTGPWPLMIYSGLFFEDLIWNDFSKDDLWFYADQIALDGMNATRVFSNTVWPGKESRIIQPFPKTSGGKYDLSGLNPEYINQAIQRLAFYIMRKITVIVDLFDFCSMKDEAWEISPWNGKNNINLTATDPQDFMTNQQSRDMAALWISQFVRMTRSPFSPFIIYSANEPPAPHDNLDLLYEWTRFFIAILKGEGVPNDQIQIWRWDDSNYIRTLMEDLNSSGFGSAHTCISKESIDFVAASSGWNQFQIPNGTYCSNDGPDFMGIGKGRKFFWWDEKTAAVAARGDYETLTYVVEQALRLKMRGYEHLSATPCEFQKDPKILDSITNGYEERRAIREAFRRVFGR